jgi:hypothetical protein
VGFSVSDKTEWRYVLASVQGTSHITGNTPCQDASLIRELHTAAGDSVLVLLVADGAGSAAQAQVGSKLVCQTILELISAWFESGKTLAAIDGETVRNWFEGRVRSVFNAQAEGPERSIRDFATTIICAIIGLADAAYFQIGDGAIVVADSDAYRTVFWPQTGEYANTTHFVTDDDALKHLMFQPFDQATDEVALFSDGLQMLALNYTLSSVHEPFFAPMFGKLRAEPPGESSLNAALEDFLNSAPINSRTDDDKTLLLATRRSISFSRSESKTNGSSLKGS